MSRIGWFIALLLLPLAAAAQVYRWVDDKGRVHYSQTPPTGRDSKPVGPAPPPAAAPNQESLNRSLSEDKQGAAKRGDDAEDAAQVQALREQQCRQAREQLAFLESKTAVRLTTTDETGKVSRTTDEQYQQRRAELQKAVASECS